MLEKARVDVKTLAWAMALLLASGCCMGRRSWSFEESGRIDSVIARGQEPLEDTAAGGVPLPNVVSTPSAPLALSSHSFGSGGSKRVNVGSRSKKGKSKSKGKATKSSSEKGFSFSGL